MAKNLEEMVGQEQVSDIQTTHPTYTPSPLANTRTKLRNFGLALTLLAGYVLTACTQSVTARPTVPLVTKTPAAATQTYTPTATQGPTATYTPTATATPRPSPTPRDEFGPEDFGLPVAFEGSYALENKLGYAPCYHWDPTTFNPKLVTPDNWSDFFHAGDMYILNTSSAPLNIVVLSPVTGIIQDVQDFGDNGIMLNISTDFIYDGKTVNVGVGHINSLFPGDQINPAIKEGSYILKGQPIAISNQVYQWGRSEQSIDIGIRNGPEGASPVYSNFSPDSYIDPFPFLIDDLQTFSDNIYYDTFRSHCLKSGHFP